MTPALRVSICGGGIGGLTLAFVLVKYGKLCVDVFEAGPTITTVGAGVGFYARAIAIMKELGLYDEIVKMAIRPPEKDTGPIFRKSDQRDGYHWFTKKLDGGELAVHRKDLMDFFLRQISDSCGIYTSKKLDFYDIDHETGKISLHFTDGSSTVTDVLVGADGIRSATRKTMYQKLAASSRDDVTRKKLLNHIDPVWTGIMVYRSLIPTAKLLQRYPGVEPPTRLTLRLGKNKHIVTFPISQGHLINAVFFIHNSDAFGTPFEGRWVMDVSEKEISDQFEDWEPLAVAMVKCVETPSRWAVHSLRPLPYYVDGMVVLLGDAAHAMEPHFGAGAGQAIEDAYVLGRLLSHELTHEGNVADALRIYEEVRLPFANGVVRGSQTIGRYYGFQRVSPDGPVPGHDTPEELERLRQTIEDAWNWQNEPASVWEEAEERWRAACTRKTGNL